MIYPHSMLCSGDWRKPIGSPGCACLSAMRRGWQESIDHEARVKYRKVFYEQAAR